MPREDEVWEKKENVLMQKNSMNGNTERGKGESHMGIGL